MLSADFFSIPEDEIRQLVSVLTIVGGRIVYGDGEFSVLAPPLPPAMPDWPPVNHFGGYFKPVANAAASHQAAQSHCGCASRCAVHGHAHGRAYQDTVAANDQRGFWGALGCSCWAI